MPAWEISSLVAAGLVPAWLAWIRYVEPWWLATRKVDLPLHSLPPRTSLRILHLSDFHSGWVVPLSFIEKAICRGLALEPDLAVVTGDFINANIEDAKAYGETLEKLSKKVPTFAVLGNHDGGVWAGSLGGYRSENAMERLLEESGISVLENKLTRIDVAGQSVDLIGLGDLWSGRSRPEDAFAGFDRDPSIPVIALAHNPDCRKSLRPYPWDLLLCGHTHGGQVNFGPLGTPFAPIADHSFEGGLHLFDGRWIHVSRGVGMTVQFRFNCRPEVGILTLRGETSAS